MHLVTCESIQQNDAVISGGQHHYLAVVAEFHYFYLVVVFAPVSEGTRFTVRQAVDADSDHLFIFLLDRPSNSESYACRVEVGDGVGRHALGFHIQFELAFLNILINTHITGAEVPNPHGVVITGGEKVVVFGVHGQVGDAVAVTLEHFYDSILVDRPVEDEVVLFGSDEDRIIVMGVGELFDLVVFHEQLAVGLGVGGEVDRQGLAVGDVEDLPIVGEVEASDISVVVFYYFGRFQGLHHRSCQLLQH